MALRDSELLVALPTQETRRELDLVELQTRIECMPGVVCVALDKPREKFGNLFIAGSGASYGNPLEDIEAWLDECCEKFLSHTNVSWRGYTEKMELVKAEREDLLNGLKESYPWYFNREAEQSENLQERLRPDAGTVVSSGVDEVQAGDRLLLRPYRGLRTDLEFCKDLAFYGVTRPLDDSLLCVQRGRDWLPMWDWVIAVRETSQSEIHSVRAPKVPIATVSASGPLASVSEGERVALTTDPNKSLEFQFGDVEGELIKEFERDRYKKKFRQIYAVIEDDY